MHRTRAFAVAAALVGVSVMGTGAYGAESEGRGENESAPPLATTDEVEAADALEIASALAVDDQLVTGAEFEHSPSSDAGASAGVGSALTGFPVDGEEFAVLSTGVLDSVPAPGYFADTSLGGGAVRGDSDRDVTVLRLDLDIPDGANCLGFDFRFLSEEYPRYVGTQYNDAFIAEVGESTWTTDGSSIIAPDNIAFDEDGEVVSINSTGIGGMTPERGVGTAFDGGLGSEDGNADGAATVRLSASQQVSPGQESLYLSIFDQGDTSLDSVVFLDNLRVGFAPDPGLDCTPGAVVVTHDLDLSPAVGTGPVGSEHTVTATLTEDDGPVLPDAEIEFVVTGANSATGTSVTDAEGNAQFTYAGANPGADTITACYRHDGAEACTASASVAFSWTAQEGAIERIWGPDRYGTASQVSATWEPHVPVAYIATGVNYPDALPASALAGATDSPVLLTKTNALPADTVDELALG